MLIGYADKLSVKCGEEVSFKVSADRKYTAQIVRLIGMKEVEGKLAVDERHVGPATGEFEAKVQPIKAGSFVSIDASDFRIDDGLGFRLWFKPTASDLNEETVLHLSSSDGRGQFRVRLTAERHVAVDYANADGSAYELRSSVLVKRGAWFHIEAALRPDNLLTLALSAHDGRVGDRKEAVVTGRPFEPTALVLGGPVPIDGSQTGRHFNGCLADVSAFGKGDEVFASWDFSLDMAGDVARDTHSGARHGKLVNSPARAILGPNWDKRTVRWTDDPSQWNALHFHDDDVGDAGWDTTFSIKAPEAGGIYAARLSNAEEIYHVPFYVRPRVARSRVLFVAPTNTYLAYGNEHLWEGERGVAHQKMMSFPIVLDDAEKKLQEFPELGRSLYDRHSDDSGVIYASRLRPLTNFQPNYINWLAGGPRHFSGDFFITGWLASIGVEFDVATDEDVDVEGVALLRQYDVVLTGSHPEYPTTAEFDAFESYVDGGGKLMYLGANGFFWITSFVDAVRSTIEVRRGYSAQRNWTSHPAELHHSSSGEQGGAYRHRGRDQNPLLGIGMAGAGWGPASGYTRTDASYKPEVSWAFEGIDGKVLGEHGYLLGGAAGDELDHADPVRGTPETTVVLMSSRHNDLYFPSLDAVTEVGPNQQGSTNPNVRADVVLVEHPGGGKVFSTGSICWAGSLGTNHYSNDIAQLTTNVLRRYLAGS